MADFDRKFFFVTGKGGVGKTTVSAALARALSARGRRVLLAFTESASSAELLGTGPLDYEIRALTPSLSVTLIEPDAALQEYAEMTLRSRALAKAAVGNRYSKAFLRAVPGLHPWAVLGSAWYRSVERVDGRPRFDSVVLDAPATGHGLEMLKVPLVIRETAAPGILKRDAEAAWSMLCDPAQTGVVVVSLPEDLAARESLELVDELAHLGIEPQRLVLNARLDELFTPDQANELAQLQVRDASPAARAVLQVASRRAETEQAQREVETKLREQLSFPVITLPWVEEAARPAGIAELSKRFS